MHYLVKIIFSKFIFMSATSHAQSRLDVVGRIESITETKSEKSDFVRIQFDQKLKIRPRKVWSQFYFNSRFLAEGKFIYNQPETYQIDLRELNIHNTSENFVYSLGIQEVVWGDTLLLPPTDIIHTFNNERDFFLELENIRKPQPMLNTMLLLGPFSTEFIWIPVPLVDDIKVQPTQPLGLSEFIIKRKRRDINDGEIAIRSGFQVDQLDTKFLFVHQETRTPRFDPFGEEQITRSKAYGNNTSIAWDYAVMRGDLLFRETEHNYEHSLAVGLDVILGDGNFIIQTNQNSDHHKKKRDWIITQLNQNFNSFELTLFYLVGIGNADKWARAEALIRLNHNIDIQLEHHEIRGTGNGLGPMFERRRTSIFGLQTKF